MTRSMLVAVLACATATALSLPAVARAQTAGQDSVEGSAQSCPSETTCPGGGFGLFVPLSVHAVSGPVGQDPTGTVTWAEEFAGGFSQSETTVSCLSVAGHVAIIGVAGTRTITLPLGGVSVSIAGLIRMTDGGGPASGLDTFAFDVDQGPLPIPGQPPLPPLPAPTDCSSFPATSPVFTNAHGRPRGARRTRASDR